MQLVTVRVCVCVYPVWVRTYLSNVMRGSPHNPSESMPSYNFVFGLFVNYDFLQINFKPGPWNLWLRCAVRQH